MLASLVGTALGLSDFSLIPEGPTNFSVRGVVDGSLDKTRWANGEPLDASDSPLGAGVGAIEDKFV